MSWRGNIKYDDFCSIVSAYMLKKYGHAYTWTVEMSTPKVKKSVYGDPGYYPKYTMSIINIATGEHKAKSDELEGSNKTWWSGEQLVEFITTLQDI